MVDPIERNDAINVVSEACFELRGIFKLCEDALKALPSAQPERKKGRWVEYDSESDKYDEIRCSCCGRCYTVDAYHWTDIGFTKDDLKFCPNCGADMRGEHDERTD